MKPQKGLSMISTQVIITNGKLTTKYGREYGYACWRPNGNSPEKKVFLLHSLGFDKHALWDTIAEIMCSELNMAIYAFDLPGHGESSIDMTGVTYDSIQDDVLDLIESLHIAPCHFIGCSIGSEFGLRTAVDRPHLLSSVTAIGAATIESRLDDEQMISTLIKQWKSKGMAALAKFILSEPFIFGKRFLEDEGFERKRIEERTRISKMDPNSLHLWELWLQRKIVVDYSRIEIPLLVMCGTVDGYFLPNAENLIAMVPGAELELIEDVGHEPPIESPGKTYSHIKRFWKKLPMGKR